MVKLLKVSLQQQLLDWGQILKFLKRKFLCHVSRPRMSWRQLWPRSSFSESLTHSNSFIQKICKKFCKDWDDAKEAEAFTPIRVRYSGGFDGNPRRAVEVSVETTEAAHGHVILPAVRFSVRELTCQSFIRIMGKHSIVTGVVFYPYFV